MCVTCAPQNRKRYKMIHLDTKYRRVLSFIVGVVLVSGIFTSCSQGTVDVLYVLGMITENTAPDDVQDPEIHEAYVTLLGEFNNELAELMGSTASPFLGTGVTFKKTEGFELAPKNFRPEDERRIADYNRYLSRLKQIESSYKERIEGLEKRDGTSFSIVVHYILLRGGESIDSVLLQEYEFELKYN